MSHLAEIYPCFLKTLPGSVSLLMYIRGCVFLDELAIYTGASCCIVKFPDEVCVGHTHSLQSATRQFSLP